LQVGWTDNLCLFDLSFDQGECERAVVLAASRRRGFTDLGFG
jgi:hypothetical protein